ncbi:hypothetical protein BGZ65_003470, partial [Modicella reniformis]
MNRSIIDMEGVEVEVSQLSVQETVVSRFSSRPSRPRNLGGDDEIMRDVDGDHSMNCNNDKNNDDDENSM